MERDIPDESETIWNEARDYIEQGNYDKAIEIYKYILIRHSDDAVATRCANAYLGDIYITLKNPDLAQPHIQRAIKADPEDPSYRYQLGFVHSQQNKWKKAIKEFEFAVGKVPHNSEYLRGLGWAVYNGGDTARGLSFLRKASGLDPDNINILNDLAVVYAGLLDFRQALQCINKVLSINPGDNLAKELLDRINYLQKRSSHLS